MNRGTGRQDATGNALEYAIAMRIVSVAAGASLQESAITRTAGADFNESSADMRRRLNAAATASVNHLFELESLQQKGVCEVRMQPDRVGQEGDPRDLVLILKLKNNELGISVKLNNAVMKNSRLQRTAPNFCGKWNLGCTHSDKYFRRVESAFKAVDDAKEKGARNWNEMDEKREKVYAPVLNAFMEEFSMLAKDSGVCKSFARYMVGVHDYYKVMAYLERKEESVFVQGFNFGGSLSCNKIQLPESLLSIVPKKDGGTTLILSFDGGWVFSMRIHNATTKLENSLKWDIGVKEYPKNLYSRRILL